MRKGRLLIFFLKRHPCKGRSSSLVLRLGGGEERFSSGVFRGASALGAYVGVRAGRELG